MITEKERDSYVRFIRSRYNVPIIILSTNDEVKNINAKLNLQVWYIGKKESTGFDIPYGTSIVYYEAIENKKVINIILTMEQEGVRR